MAANNDEINNGKGSSEEDAKKFERMTAAYEQTSKALHEKTVRAMVEATKAYAINQQTLYEKFLKDAGRLDGDCRVLHLSWGLEDGPGIRYPTTIAKVVGLVKTSHAKVMEVMELIDLGKIAGDKNIRRSISAELKWADRSGLKPTILKFPPAPPVPIRCQLSLPVGDNYLCRFQTDDS